MSLFNHPDFDDHEQVQFCCDADCGLRAIIAVHNTNLGPSLGGCRMWPYRNEDEALTDVLRLSRGMTYKSAISNLPLGGGKSVIIGDPRRDKSDALLHAMGRSIDCLGGRYIGAEDSGTKVEDLKIMATETRHVAGIVDKTAADGATRSGDPSPATAYGVFAGLKAAVKHRLGKDSLDGLRVAIQGVGNVGYRLGKYLQDAGARLWVTDIHEDQVQRAVADLGATAMPAEQIFCLDVDVLAPCALGSVINDDTLPQLRASVVAGAANNQLAHPQHGKLLMERGILYAPDYVVNAGGIIDIYYERTGHDRAKLLAHLDSIHDVCLEIFERAEAQGEPTSAIADQIAEERFQGKGGNQ